MVSVVSFALMVFWLAESRFGLLVRTERTIKHYYNQETIITNPPVLSSIIFSSSGVAAIGLFTSPF